jgi:hypothetical protein
MHAQTVVPVEGQRKWPRLLPGRLGLSGRFAVVGTLILIGIGAAFALLDNNLRSIHKDVESVLGVAQPMAEAAVEMEINILEAGFRVTKYLHRPEPIYRDRYANDNAEFRQFHALYRRLSTNSQQHALADQLQREHEEYVAVGARLFGAKDLRDANLHTVTQSLERIISILDGWRADSTDRRKQQLLDQARLSMLRLERILVAQLEYKFTNDPTLDVRFTMEINERIQAGLQAFGALLASPAQPKPEVEKLSREFEVVPSCWTGWQRI